MANKYDKILGEYRENDAQDLSGYATKELDNLDSVAINTSLISDSDDTDDLGSSSIRWKDNFN